MLYAGVSPQTGKVYVGQHDHGKKGESVQTARWSRHQRLNSCSAIHHACVKYNIQWFVLERCPSSQLNDREKYWITHFNSLWPNGYNLNEGGGNAAMSEHSIAKLKATVMDPAYRAKASQKAKDRQTPELIANRAEAKRKLGRERQDVKRQQLSGKELESFERRLATAQEGTKRRKRRRVGEDVPLISRAEQAERLKRTNASKRTERIAESETSEDADKLRRQFAERDRKLEVEKLRKADPSTYLTKEERGAVAKSREDSRWAKQRAQRAAGLEPPRTCTSCKQTKDVAMFPTIRSKAGSLCFHPYCKACKAEKARACRLAKKKRVQTS